MRDDIREVLGPGGLAAAVVEGWETRDEQLQMAEGVGVCLETGGTLIVEAPTGVGKTLAYLVPAILDGRRVIVSTQTKTLQEQIVEKDIPLLAEVFARGGIELRSALTHDAREASESRFALMKGRANYLCLDRLDRQLSQHRLDFDRTPTLLDRIARWAPESIRGDRAELSDLPEDTPLWPQLDARAEICIGGRCPRYEDCFVVRMRRQAANAEIVVVNHHLLLADLALRAEVALSGDGRQFGEVIPRAELVIVDEAHGLEEIASDYFGGSVTSHKLARLARDARQWGLTVPRATELEARVGAAVDSVDHVFAALPGAEGRARIDRSERFERARKYGADAVVSLRSLSAWVEGHADDPMADSIGGRADTLASAVQFIVQAESPDYVYWYERESRGTRLGASPIEVGALLREHLFEAFRSTVLTSATLSTGSDRGFDYFAGRVGAPEDATTERLGTPFDFARQVALFMPPDMPPPDAEGFVDAACAAAESLIEMVGGGALFLFTSHRVMRAAHEKLRGRLRFPVLRQGLAPKRTLIERFVLEAPAVLFATASFWEGVDIPGDPLRLVLIDRLPFASPADPVVAARASRVEEGGKSAFATYSVPHAILRLKQGFGRLVRTKNDVGVVAFLDSRIRTRSYGRRFLKALPAARRITEPDDLRLWLAERGMHPPP